MLFVVFILYSLLLLISCLGNSHKTIFLKIIKNSFTFTLLVLFWRNDLKTKTSFSYIALILVILPFLFNAIENTIDLYFEHKIRTKLKENLPNIINDYSQTRIYKKETYILDSKSLTDTLFDYLHKENLDYTKDDVIHLEQAARRIALYYIFDNLDERELSHREFIHIFRNIVETHDNEFLKYYSYHILKYYFPTEDFSFMTNPYLKCMDS